MDNYLHGWTPTGPGAYAAGIGGPWGNEGSFGNSDYDQESGLLYLINRYYDPSTGQFLNVDTLVALTHAPYSYAADNPVNLTDPTGQFFGLDNLVVGAIGAVTGAVGYGLSVIDGSRSFSWQNLGAATAGGAVAGATGAECVDSPAVGSRPRAFGGAAGSAVAYALGSGSKSWAGLACTVGEGALGGAAGGVLGGKLFPARGLPGQWSLPRKISNIWNPGINSKLLYGSGSVGGATGAVPALASPCC